MSNRSTKIEGGGVTTSELRPLTVGTVINGSNGHCLEVTNIFLDGEGNPFSIVCKDLEAKDGEPAWHTILMENVFYSGDRVYH